MPDGRGGVQEKKIVLDISKRLKNILKRRGFKVKMTRNDDRFVSLQKRTEIASRSHADLFVSIHANSSPSRSVQGFEVFTSKHLGLKEKTEAQRITNQRLMFNNLSMKNGSKDVENIISDMLYTHKQGEAKALAKQLVKKTTKIIKTKNRGEKQSRFYVLRNTLIPASIMISRICTVPYLFSSVAKRRKRLTTFD